MHLTCTNMPKEKLREALDTCKAGGPAAAADLNTPAGLGRSTLFNLSTPALVRSRTAKAMALFKIVLPLPVTRGPVSFIRTVI